MPVSVVVPVPSWFTDALPVIFGAKVMSSVWLKFTTAVPVPPVTSAALSVPAVLLPPKAPMFKAPLLLDWAPRVRVPEPPPTLTLPPFLIVSVAAPCSPTVRVPVLFHWEPVPSTVTVASSSGCWARWPSLFETTPPLVILSVPFPPWSTTRLLVSVSIEPSPSTFRVPVVLVALAT